LIDSSTISPEVTRRIGEEAARRGVKMLDAPVGGGQANAVAGNLIMLVGGDAEVVEEVRDILETVGERLLHVGPLGSGEGLKLANNLTTAILGCMLAEGFGFAERIGLDKEKLYELLSGNVPRLVSILSRKVIDGDLQPGFMTRLMNKDLRLILSLAETHEIPLPMGALAKQMYQFAQNKGLRDKDFTSVASLYKEKKSYEK
jgi:3-hydroxyisobutyrate dehydrogenase